VSWQDIGPALACENAEAFKQMLVWSRDRYESGETRPVQGVVAVFVGHTPIKEAMSLGNVFYIDTGAVFKQYGALTIVDLATLEP
jgi:serine/threonine protein phosphatase 1